MIVRVYSNFDQLPAAHQSLLEKHGANDFLRSHLWFRNLIDTTLIDGTEIRLYAVEDETDGMTLRCLLAAQAPASRRGSIIRRRPYCGRWTLGGITNEKTILFGPIIPQPIGNPTDAVQCLAEHLWAEKPRWELIDFSTMDAESELTGILATSLRRAGYVVKTYRGYTNCYQPGADCFNSYRAKLPKSSREQIRKHFSRYRKLQQSRPTRLELFEDATDIDRAIRDFATVFQASWKQPDVHPEYIPRLIATGLAAKTMRLLVLYVEDQPAAAELAMISEGKGILYRTAYDPRFAQHSPGAIVTTKMVEHLIDRENVTEIDFGRDAEDHKKFWVRQRRFRQGIIAYHCRTVGGLFGLCWHLCEGFWSMVKRKERE